MEPQSLAGRLSSVRLVMVALLMTAVTACSGSKPTAAPPTPSTSADETSPTASWVVPAAKDVLGRWRAVTVRGHAPPSDSRRDITMIREGNAYWASWSDGLNTLRVRWTLTPTGCTAHSIGPPPRSDASTPHAAIPADSACLTPAA
jgi:hypothetical protein